MNVIAWVSIGASLVYVFCFMLVLRIYMQYHRWLSDCKAWADDLTRRREALERMYGTREYLSELGYNSADIDLMTTNWRRR